MKPKIRKAVVPVAGLGTRGLPFTKEVPKEMLPIVDTPVIHFIMEEIVEAGIEQVILVTGRGKQAIENYFAPAPQLETWLRERGKGEAEVLARLREMAAKCEIVTVRQTEPLGLGDAVLRARDVVGNSPFLLCLGDEFFPRWNPGPSAVSRLLEASAGVGESVVGTIRISPSESQRHGVVDFGTRETPCFPAKVIRTVEKPSPESAPSRYGIVGRYAFQPEIFECLASLPPGAGSEIQLTDGMDRLARAGKLYALHLEGEHYDLGNHLEYIKAQVAAALHRSELSGPLREFFRTI